MNCSAQGHFFLFWGWWNFVIESVFYFQICVFLFLLVMGTFKRSASFMSVAGVFALLTAVMLNGDGIAYPTGYTIAGTDSDNNTMSVDSTYTTYYTWNSSPIEMWYWMMFAGGFVCLIVSFLMVYKGRLAGDIVEET
jgi:hypothetical protein